MSTAREFKFRVWNNDHWEEDPRTAIGWLRLTPRTFSLAGFGKTIEQFTGFHDRNGKEIYEGDIVVLGPAEFEKTLLNPEETRLGGIPIYEVDTDKPLPSADVIYARGFIEWDQWFNRYSFRYVWRCREWGGGGGGGSIGLERTAYIYEIVGNIHENPELLNESNRP